MREKNILTTNKIPSFNVQVDGGRMAFKLSVVYRSTTGHYKYKVLHLVGSV